MFPNYHVNFYSCYFLTRKLTPGIQEVSSQPVYLPDGMVQMVWTVSVDLLPGELVHFVVQI